MDRGAITHTLRQIIADVFCIDSNEIHAECRFVTEFGDDSLGMLEIAFQIEKRLKIKFNQAQVFDLAAYTDKRGRLTAVGLSEVKQKFPFLQYDRVVPNTSTDDFWTELLRTYPTTGTVIGIL